MTDTPTAAMLKSRFPEFEPVADALIEMIVPEAVAAVGASWLERDQLPAQLLYIAHTLSAEGEPGRSITVADGGSLRDAGRKVASRKVGDVEVRYEASASTTAGTASASSGGYATTVYGQRFLRIMARNFCGPVVA